VLGITQLNQIGAFEKGTLVPELAEGLQSVENSKFTSHLKQEG
jgi:hypothetical protein